MTHTQDTNTIDPQKLSLETLTDAIGFELVDAVGLRLPVSFPNAPVDAQVGIARGAISFLVSDGVIGTAYAPEGRLVLLLTQAEATPQRIAFRLGVGWATEPGAFGPVLPLYDSTGQSVSVASFDGDLSLDGQDAIFAMSGVEARLEFFRVGQSNFSASQLSSVHAMSSGVVTVPAGRRPPEFSVGAFDDSAYSRPRPVRLGVPVLSTVPAPGTGLTSVEQTWLDNGLGDDTRTVFFRVLCNQTLETLTAGAASPLVTLKILLPNGVDTVGPATSMPLTWNPVVNGIPFYTGKFTFSREDTVSTVDGFAYVFAYVPLHISFDLPMRLRVGTAHPNVSSPAVAAFSTGLPAFSTGLPASSVNAVRLFTALAPQPRAARLALPLSLRVSAPQTSFLPIRLTVQRAQAETGLNGKDTMQDKMRDTMRVEKQDVPEPAPPARLGFWNKRNKRT